MDRHSSQLMSLVGDIPFATVDSRRGRGLAWAASRRRIAGILMMGFLVLAWSAASADSKKDSGDASLVSRARALSGARQVGPSCGFYANVPALTLVSGINIVDGSHGSRVFVRSVYGLPKGDFSMSKSFGNQRFFKLFGIPLLQGVEWSRFHRFLEVAWFY
jgi:hypothetical protein